jgi:hypothetical protein
MKCPFCPKEIKEEKNFLKFLGSSKKELFSSPDFDKHIKIHIKKTK